MAIDLADNNPRVVYTVAEGASQSVFAVPFEFFEDADVKVYVDSVLKAEGTDYTLTGGDGATGTLTFNSAVVGATGGSEVVLFRRIAIERTTDFQQGMEISRAALNAQLDTLTALVADMNDRWDRAVHISDFDTGQVDFILPASSVRAGNYFAFDENGDPVMTAGTTSDIVVSTFGQSLVSKDNAGEALTLLGVSSAGQALIDDADAAAQRTTLGLGTVATLDEVTSAQWRSNTADKVLSTDQVWGAMAEVTLTDGANIALDLSTGFDFTVTLAGNRTLDNPTNTKVGQRGRIRVVQDATGSRTLAFGTSYEFAGGTAPTLTTTASAEDILYYDVVSSTRIIVTSILDVS